MGRDGPAFGLRYLVDVNREIILVLKRLRWCLVADSRKIQLTPLSRIDMSSSGDDKMGGAPKNLFTQYLYTTKHHQCMQLLKPKPKLQTYS